MNRHNIFDLDWSLTFSVELRTQFYGKIWSLFYNLFIASIILCSNGD